MSLCAKMGDVLALLVTLLYLGFNVELCDM